MTITEIFDRRKVLLESKKQAEIELENLDRLELKIIKARIIELESKLSHSNSIESKTPIEEPVPIQAPMTSGVTVKESTPNPNKWEEFSKNGSPTKLLEKRYEYKGESLTLKEWSHRYHMNYSTLWNRITRSGMSISEALETGVNVHATRTPVEQRKNAPTLYEYAGEKHSIKEWSEITEIAEKTLRARLAKGWSVERTLGTSLNKNMSHPSK